MIIDRLRVRGKLNLLLLLPMTAVVLVAVPFVGLQIQNATSAGTTAASANVARDLGALVWELQRERLITAGYLADRDATEADLMLQHHAVSATADHLLASLNPDTSEELVNALVRIGSLGELRTSVHKRGAAVDSVARAYHAIIEALIDSLRLVPQLSSDAEGTRQLTALDALLRANEESSLRGMALVATVISPQIGRDLLATSSAQSQMFTERFTQQADAEQAALVVLVDQGEAARRVEALAQQLLTTAGTATPAFVRGVLDAVAAQADLRRLTQDKLIDEIAGAAASRAALARTTAWGVGSGTAVLLALVIALAVVVTRSIANPLQRLTTAAATVADLTNAELVRVTDVETTDEQPPRLTAIDVGSGDELGELAVAFNQVQSTAAMLLERQVTTRRNVSLMFANVAQRTQNLVRRQLTLVDELERDEQNTRLLSKLYRLDHLSTRLRRNADNLMVVSGSRNDNRIATPTPLSTVLRSSLAEIEDYRRVRLGTVYEATISASLVPDLVLVFAELLENATLFSPPESTVDVHAVPGDDGWCEVTIVDRGIGMTARKLAEENRRLVERERLDIAPTSVLGLFVVGRLARRHGLSVVLEPTDTQGITARVSIPPSLHVRGASPVPIEASELPMTSPRKPFGSSPSLDVIHIPAVPVVAGSFAWFLKPPTPLVPPPALPADPAALPAVTVSATASATAFADTVSEAAAAAPPAKQPTQPLEQRGGLNRRVRGAQLPEAALRPTEHHLPELPVPAGPVHDPMATRETMDVFQDAFARAAATLPDEELDELTVEVPISSGGDAYLRPQAPPTDWPPREAPAVVPMEPPPAPLDTFSMGLTRRTPGASLAAEIREAARGGRPENVAPQRDPEAERMTFEGYTAALAKAEEQNNPE
ncbi:MAG TPA: nitrate- and nitrite sensing domain-containing protein [Candidatus Limnocylindrales bacterium]|nr:nitrate- and nitrite sensing domain-containing protein [Candidatus Limnocylindrales bacterium]